MKRAKHIEREGNNSEPEAKPDLKERKKESEREAQCKGAKQTLNTLREFLFLYAIHFIQIKKPYMYVMRNALYLISFMSIILIGSKFSKQNNENLQKNKIFIQY